MMNKAWITGITVASVAGTGGAAFATMQANTHQDSASAAAPQITAAATSTTDGTQTYEFQAGPAGIVHLSATNNVLTVVSALPSAGWTLLDYTSPAGHVEARLTDGQQIVTFSADIVNRQVTAGIESAPTPTTAAPVTTAAPTTAAPVTTPAPQPAVPPEVLTPITQAPTPGYTSAPSSANASGGENESDDNGNESHESEGESEGSDD